MTKPKTLVLLSNFYTKVTFQTDRQLNMIINTEKYFEYDYENLNPASKEFKLLKKIFDARSNFTKLENFQIYLVKENNSIRSIEQKSNNLMLFHGTNQKGATGILKEGFRNSEKGWFGKGVYMTDCSEIALNYNKKFNVFAHNFYTFVNEVLESEKL